MNPTLIQNTPEWLEFRRTKIGASDAPVILGISSWKTPYQLWLEKMGGASSPITARQRRGHELEEAARQLFEMKMGIIMFPKVMLHPSLSWMMASLDGIDLEGKSAVEIKCPNPNDHEVAKAGKVPEKYFPQLQHQMVVAGLERMFYFSFDGSDGVIVEVRRDEAFIEQMMVKEKAFWNCMETATPPPLGSDDFVGRSDPEWTSLAEQWREAQQTLDALKQKEDGLREALIQMAENKNICGGGIRLTQSVRKGAVQYSQIPELQGIELDKYRGSPSTMWRLTSVR